MDSAENVIDECDEKYDAYALLNTANTRPLATIVKNGKESKKSEKKHNENNNGPTKQYASNSRGVFAQCLVTGSILLLTAGCGMPIGYSATLLPKLNQTNGTLHVDEDLGSWIASLHSLATPFGSLLSGPLMDAIGRRGALQVATIPMAVGWIVMGFAENITSILAARLTSGFAVGLCAVPVQILISEIADPGLRGFLVGTPFVAYSFGILLVYALGATLEWRTVAFLGTVLPALALIALGLSPESPAWLVRRRKMEAANKALMWFRGDDAIQVKTEMAILESRARADIARMSSTVSMSQQASSAISRMLNTGVLKPLVIVNIFNILQISAGTYTIVFYAVEIISSVGVNIDNYLVAVITAVVRFAFCVVYCILLLRTSRRLLAIISSVGTAAASLVLAGFLLARNGANGTDLDLYVVGGCIFVYVAANTIGILGLPGLMVGELFPQKARGVAGGFSFFIFNMSLFGVTKLFPTMKSSIGISGVFTVFGASALLLAVFVYVTMPETKGRTLQQIEDYFQEGNMLWLTRRKEAKINPSAVPLTTVISG